jgi:hypothetical protein
LTVSALASVAANSQTVEMIAPMPNFMPSAPIVYEVYRQCQMCMASPERAWRMVARRRCA